MKALPAEERKRRIREGKKKYYSSAQGLLKQREAQKRYYAKPQHRDGIRRRAREYYWRNRDRLVKRIVAYNKDNPKRLDWEWEYRRKVEVRPKFAARRAKRRASLSGATGSYTPKEWQHLVRQADGKCLCCGERKPLTPDHIIPLARGGRNDIANIQPLCLSCNCRKGARSTTDYRLKVAK